ncbi:choline/glycine/proline betaine transport protein [Haloactinopolyspora alba]|uniref:Choline/glycine/proline betaine transport protein n=1 Tax=Haloactinopolyspora alba TaxID=648780 RepID=A0A2P8DWH7_9ACTN|nr:choline BCCT transporter BetT [Haloactinopolyspora alba]PSL01570.1 choline/glycine/proline betaine transport protein [Haloactinopolyspora alba]
MSEPEQTETSVGEPASRVNPVVFYGSSACILAIALWAMIAPDMAADVIGEMVGWISEYFGWYYFLAATIFLVFVVFIGFSRYGRIRLGPEHSKPDFSLFTWGAMLFAAGIGIDLMFFSVAEPVSQYLDPPQGDGENTAAARQAVVWTLFHYGISGWAMYALMGMVLGYFAYRYNLPLSIRSALYPIFGRRIHGRIGHTVDIAAVLGTIFGIATSLGIGVVQLNYGLNFLFDVPEATGAQIGLIVVAVLMATVSAVAGVDKGIRRLSELNVILAIGLMLFILFSGDTVFLLNGIVLNIGDYVSGFPGMTMNTFAFDRPTEWLNLWTLFFWAWWIAWAPFVGLFLARISRGRTIRQFVAATLVIPFLFILVWISIFGNSALDVVIGGNQEFGQAAMDQPEQAFYSLLDQYPGVTLSASVATFTGLLFYVTSADSGALVMGNFTSYLKSSTTDASQAVRIFWAAATGLLTLAMLIVGGVTTLQNATIIMGLPFSFVMFLVMLGLYRALRVEGHREDAFRAALPSSLSMRTAGEARSLSRSWRQRIERATSFPDPRAAASFIDGVCRPAVREVAEELRAQGADVTVSDSAGQVVRAPDLPCIDLVVDLADERPFAYRLHPVEAPTPSFASRSPRFEETYIRIEVHLDEGGQGYDVMGFSQDQLIGDILDQYERHLEFLRLHREATGNSSTLPDTETTTPGTMDDGPDQDGQRPVEQA